MKRLFHIILVLIITLASCEEVIEINLNSVTPALVAEAIIYKDSVCVVHLSTTVNYFSDNEHKFVEDAIVTISDGTSNETLNYTGNGNYRGSVVIGTEGYTYNINIEHNGLTYSGISEMPLQIMILSSHYNKSNATSILNPTGETVYTVNCEFLDDPLNDNYYMIQYTQNDKLIEKRYFMLTENEHNGGSLSWEGTDTISFSESIFFDGGNIELELFSMDESVYRYFLEMDDILFWKRRYIPPEPYNPKSNLSNGALGFFAAWSYDSVSILLD